MFDRKALFHDLSALPPAALAELKDMAERMLNQADADRQPGRGERQ